MATHSLFLPPGGGIGTEIIVEVEKAHQLDQCRGPDRFRDRRGPGGWICLWRPWRGDHRRRRGQGQGPADAVFFGAVGGPKWDDVPYEQRPEAALLRLRRELGVFANLRPAICYPALADASSLKRELVEGLDILIEREPTGGVYFGDPRPSRISAMARSAPSTPRSTKRMKSTALPASPFIWPAPGLAGVLADGLRTSDIAQDNRKLVGTEAMGAAILAKLKA